MDKIRILIVASLVMIVIWLLFDFCDRIHARIQCSAITKLTKSKDTESKNCKCSPVKTVNGINYKTADIWRIYGPTNISNNRSVVPYHPMSKWNSEKNVAIYCSKFNNSSQLTPTEKNTVNAKTNIIGPKTYHHHQQQNEIDEILVIGN